MRRFRRAALLAVVAALALGAVGLGGCAGSSATEPTLTSINFTPRLVIEIHDGALTFVPGPRQDGAAVTISPPAVPSGTVVDVANLAKGDQRLQGGTTFDTGIMRPSEHTTIVLTNATSNDLVIDIADPLDPSIKGTITVHPKPAT